MPPLGEHLLAVLRSPDATISCPRLCAKGPVKHSDLIRWSEDGGVHMTAHVFKAGKTLAGVSPNDIPALLEGAGFSTSCSSDGVTLIPPCMESVFPDLTVSDFLPGEVGGATPLPGWVTKLPHWGELSGLDLGCPDELVLDDVDELSEFSALSTWSTRVVGPRDGATEATAILIE